MQVNIYEYGRKKLYDINSDLEIENYDTEHDYSTTRLVKSIKCVDMKLEVGELIDSGYKIERAVIVENGYDVYVHNFRDELINENLELRHKLEEILKDAEKYNSRVVKDYFVRGWISKPKTLKEALEMIEDGYCIYGTGISPSMEQVVLEKDKFAEIYTETKDLELSVVVFGFINALEKFGKTKTHFKHHAELTKKFYDNDSYIVKKSYYDYTLTSGTNPEENVKIKEKPPKKVSFLNKIFCK